MKYQTTSYCFAILNCLFLILGAARLFAGEIADEAQSPTAIMEKVFDAYGGKETIEGIHTLHVKGEIEAFMLHDHGTYELYFKRGRKLWVETKYGRSSELRILNGARGYRSTDTLPFEEVSGPRYLAMVYHYKHLDILYDLIHGAYQVHPAGQSSIDGNSVKVFNLEDADGTRMDIYVDEHRYLIVKVTGYFSAGHKSIDLSAEFADFREVGTSMFPFRITNYAGGMKIAEIVFDKYFINQDIADSIFKPAIIQ